MSRAEQEPGTTEITPENLVTILLNPTPIPTLSVTERRSLKDHLSTVMDEISGSIEGEDALAYVASVIYEEERPRGTVQGHELSDFTQNTIKAFRTHLGGRFDAAVLESKLVDAYKILTRSLSNRE